MEEFAQDVARAAAGVVISSKSRNGIVLDYSESSLQVVEDMISEAAGYASKLTPDQLANMAQNFGCYILDVARREFGGRYYWFAQRNQPVLVVGEPAFKVAILAWDKVRGRLSGDEADNIPFFYAGFAERARRAEPGTDALYA